MHRSIVSLFCCCLLVGSPGCAQMRKMFGRGDGGAASPMTMEKPAQPAEMKRLEPLVGTWTGTAEMVNPPKMAKGDGPATAPASTMPTSFEGASTMKYVLDGMAMQVWRDLNAVVIETEVRIYEDSADMIVRLNADHTVADVILR